MKGHSVSTRVVSIIVAIAYIVTNTFIPDRSYAQGALASIDQLINIAIPRELSSINEIYRGNSNRIIFHIRDIHCNYEAQRNEIEIIRSILENDTDGLIKFLAIEGAEGRVDTSPLTNIKDKGTRQAIVDYLLRQGFIKGSEAYSSYANSGVGVYGIEEPSLYFENLGLFNEIHEGRDIVLDRLEKIEAEIEGEKTKVFSPELLEIIGNEGSPIEHIRYIGEKAGKAGIRIEDYSNFNNVYKAIKSEHLTNHEEIKKELFIELEGITEELKERLFTTDKERELNRKIKEVRLLGKLLKLELRRDEWETARFNDSRFMDYIPLYKRFYETGIKREGAIVENMLREMERVGARGCILLSGGFHTEGIESLLREKGISYVEILPMAGDEDGDSNYISVLLGRKAPIDMLDVMSLLSNGLTVRLGDKQVRLTLGKELASRLAEEHLNLIRSIGILETLLGKARWKDNEATAYMAVDGSVYGFSLKRRGRGITIDDIEKVEGVTPIDAMPEGESGESEELNGVRGVLAFIGQRLKGVTPEQVEAIIGIGMGKIQIGGASCVVKVTEVEKRVRGGDRYEVMITAGSAVRHTGSNLMGKVYLDSEGNELVTTDIQVHFDGAQVTFTGVDGATLYTKDGHLAKVTLVRDEHSQIIDRGIFSEMIWENMEREAQSLKNFIEQFLAGSSQVRVVEANPYIHGFFIADTIYLSRFLLENPIAIFHELCHVYYERNPGELPDTVEGKINAHTYVRGCGKKTRVILDSIIGSFDNADDFMNYVVQDEGLSGIPGDELELIAHNIRQGRRGRERFYGLQDLIFGEGENLLLTLKLSIEVKIAEFEAMGKTAEEEMDRERIISQIRMIGEIGEELLRRYPGQFAEYMGELAMPFLALSLRQINFVMTDFILDTFENLRFFMGLGQEEEIPKLITDITRDQRNWEEIARKSAYLPGIPVVVEGWEDLSPRKQDLLRESAGMLVQTGWHQQHLEEVRTLKSFVVLDPDAEGIEDLLLTIESLSGSDEIPVSEDDTPFKVAVNLVAHIALSAYHQSDSYREIRHLMIKQQLGISWGDLWTIANIPLIFLFLSALREINPDEVEEEYFRNLRRNWRKNYARVKEALGRLQLENYPATKKWLIYMMAFNRQMDQVIDESEDQATTPLTRKVMAKFLDWLGMRNERLRQWITVLAGAPILETLGLQGILAALLPDAQGPPAAGKKFKNLGLSLLGSSWMMVLAGFTPLPVRFVAAGVISFFFAMSHDPTKTNRIAVFMGSMVFNLPFILTPGLGVTEIGLDFLKAMLLHLGWNTFFPGPLDLAASSKAYLSAWNDVANESVPPDRIAKEVERRRRIYTQIASGPLPNRKVVSTEELARPYLAQCTPAERAWLKCVMGPLQEVSMKIYGRQAHHDYVRFEKYWSSGRMDDASGTQFARIREAQPRAERLTDMGFPRRSGMSFGEHQQIYRSNFPSFPDLPAYNGMLPADLTESELNYINSKYDIHHPIRLPWTVVERVSPDEVIEDPAGQGKVWFVHGEGNRLYRVTNMVFHSAFRPYFEEAAKILYKAANIEGLDQTFREYTLTMAEAFLTGDFYSLLRADLTQTQGNIFFTFFQHEGYWPDNIKFPFMMEIGVRVPLAGGAESEEQAIYEALQDRVRAIADGQGVPYASAGGSDTVVVWMLRNGGFMRAFPVDPLGHDYPKRPYPENLVPDNHRNVVILDVNVVKVPEMNKTLRMITAEEGLEITEADLVDQVLWHEVSHGTGAGPASPTATGRPLGEVFKNYWGALAEPFADAAATLSLRMRREKGIIDDAQVRRGVYTSLVRQIRRYLPKEKIVDEALDEQYLGNGERSHLVGSMLYLGRLVRGGAIKLDPDGQTIQVDVERYLRATEGFHTELTQFSISGDLEGFKSWARALVREIPSDLEKRIKDVFTATSKGVLIDRGDLSDWGVTAMAGGEGLCVTGDTLLPIVSAGEIQISKSKIQNISIVDVQPGDYVLSLNEETQRIEPHRINALLDMGIKPVYRLTTANGRSIKTTANHPYLTRHGWIKVSGLREGDEIAVPSEHALPFYADHRVRKESQLLPQPYPQKASPLFFTSLFRMEPETYKHQYKKHSYTTKSNNWWEFLKKITCQSNSKYSLCQITYEFTYVFLSFIFNFAHNTLFKINDNILISMVSRPFSLPQLEAAEITPKSDILWDRIASIEYLGYEHVYDIEVEGTHNFIGNGIFAHNTSVGIDKRRVLRAAKWLSSITIYEILKDPRLLVLAAIGQVQGRISEDKADNVIEVVNGFLRDKEEGFGLREEEIIYGYCILYGLGIANDVVGLDLITGLLKGKARLEIIKFAYSYFRIGRFGEFMWIIKEKGDSDINGLLLELRGRLIEELGISEDISNRIRDGWDGVGRVLGMAVRHPILADVIIDKVIVTMHYLRQGIGSDTGFRQMANIETRLPVLRDTIIAILNESGIDISTKRRLIRALPLGSIDLIRQLRDEAVRLVQAVTRLGDSREGMVGRIRDRIHNQPSPQDLIVVKAYREWVESDGSRGKETLGKLGYPISAGDNVDSSRKGDVLSACGNLINTLEEVYGQGSLSNLREIFNTWRSAVTGCEEEKWIIDNIITLADGEKTIELLERAIRAREKLRGVIDKSSGEALYHGIKLDNRLELLFYSVYNSLGKDYNNIPEDISLLWILIRNTLLNGYAEETLVNIMGELDGISIADNRETYLRVYSIIKRVERFLERSTGEMIQRYNRLAIDTARGINVREEDQIWVENFCSNMFRGDTIYLLSLAIKDLKRIVMGRGNISGWQVVVPGRMAKRKKKALPKTRIEIPTAKTTGDIIILPDKYTQATVGNKAYRLERITKTGHLTLGYSLYEYLLVLPVNRDKKAGIERLLTQGMTPGNLSLLRAVIESLIIPEGLLEEISQSIIENIGDGLVFLRSTTNAEDLDGYAGAGLYSSYGAVDPKNKAELARHIKKVLSSIWNERAYLDREVNGIKHTDVHMAVLIQGMIPSEYSFVVHTVNPVNNNPGEIIIEIVEGLGESLVSGSYPGNPHRFVYNYRTGKIGLTAYGDKDYKVVLRDGGIIDEPVNYKDDIFINNPDIAERLIRKIVREAIAAERLFFNKPQDIEGCIAGEEVTFVQSRDQQINIDEAKGRDTPLPVARARKTSVQRRSTGSYWISPEESDIRILANNLPWGNIYSVLILKWEEFKEIILFVLILKYSVYGLVLKSIKDEISDRYNVEVPVKGLRRWIKEDPELTMLVRWLSRLRRRPNKISERDINGIADVIKALFYRASIGLKNTVEELESGPHEDPLLLYAARHCGIKLPEEVKGTHDLIGDGISGGGSTRRTFLMGLLGAMGLALSGKGHAGAVTDEVTPWISQIVSISESLLSGSPAEQPISRHIETIWNNLPILGVFAICAAIFGLVFKWLRKTRASMQSFPIPEGHLGYAKGLQINGKRLEEKGLGSIQIEIKRAIRRGETSCKVGLNGKEITFHILRDDRFGERALVVDKRYLAAFGYKGVFSTRARKFMGEYYKDLEMDGVKVEELPDYLIFGILDNSPHLAEDCTGNHFIFANRALAEWKDLKERRVLLRTTRMHETRHETNSGINIESVQPEFDARFLWSITKNSRDLIQRLIDGNLICPNTHTKSLLKYLGPKRKRIIKDEENYLNRGKKAGEVFNHRRDTIKKNGVSGIYGERIRRLGHGEVNIYGFSSIVISHEDYFFGLWDQDGLFIAEDFISELLCRGPPSLVDEYLLYLVLMNALRKTKWTYIHSWAIRILRDKFPGHYPAEIPQGLLHKAFNEFLNKKIRLRKMAEKIIAEAKDDESIRLKSAEAIESEGLEAVLIADDASDRGI